mmetsp:Transcript_123572/g.360873  ORF Transcript_123572/g.360873 Transcript_123572/m.360873 type:complete len:101 (+) Transcript_123572:297-599(+)
MCNQCLEQRQSLCALCGTLRTVQEQWFQAGSSCGSRVPSPGISWRAEPLFLRYCGSKAQERAHSRVPVPQQLRCLILACLQQVRPGLDNLGGIYAMRLRF